MIEFKNVTKTYPNGVKANDDISFTVPVGMAVGPVGPNGAGKTTLLYMVIVMITPMYANFEVFTGFSRVLYLLNPFTHMCTLMSEAFGIFTGVNPWLSIAVLSLLAVLFTIYSFKRWPAATAAEKLNVI